MDKIYLDSCVLIAYFSSHKEEKEKKKLVKKALDLLEDVPQIQLCTSDWTITESVNIMRSRHKMQNSTVARHEQSLRNKGRIGNIKIQIVEVGILSGYDFKEFFYDVRQNLMRYHSGVGDIMHSVIMQNNKISKILTFDEKTDFKQIPGLHVIHPRDVEVTD
jgi:predicted nucleic acid-binding protein